MATDWSIQVKKFAPDADEAIIAGIVRYCGIALTKRDSSLVSFSDPTELARVRTNFLKKKLALPGTDAELDTAIAEVGAAMKGARAKQRVAVYYLLAAKFGKLEQFRKAPAKAATKPKAKNVVIADAPAQPAAKPAAKSKAAGKTSAVASKSASLASTGKKVGTKASTKVQALAEPEAGKPPVAKPKAVALKAAAPASTEANASAPAPAAPPAKPLSQPTSASTPVATKGDVETASMRWLVWLLLAVLVALLIWWLVTRGSAG